MDKLVHDDRGNSLMLSDCLGEGGQGAVFRVQRSTGHGLAVKARLDPKSGEILQDLSAYKKYRRKLDQIMALPQIAHLALPLSPLREPYCGYVMRLMEGMEPLSKYLKPDLDKEPDPNKKTGPNIKTALCKKGGLSKRFEILKDLSAILCELHSHGIVYGDLAPGNVYVSAKDADHEVWLIDLDNLAYATEVTSSVGTPLYRAPEVAMGKANSLGSDRYSFALLAYELLTFSKPFHGSITDEEPEEDFCDDTEARIESGECPYVHESDPANTPKYGFSPRLDLVMTPELEALFLQTFNANGRAEPNRRPSMYAWHQAFRAACDRLTECERGHAHLGHSCFLCPKSERSASCGQFYSLKGYLSLQAVLSPEEAPSAPRGRLGSLKQRLLPPPKKQEKEEPVEVIKDRIQVYEKKFSYHKAPKGQKPQKTSDSTTIQIPWYVLDPRKDLPYDATAFEVTLNEHGCGIERNFHPELHVDLIQKAPWPDMAGLQFQAVYQDRVFEFEMTKDE